MIRNNLQEIEDQLCVMQLRELQEIVASLIAEVRELRETKREYDALIELTHKRNGELLGKLGFIPDYPDDIVMLYREVEELRKSVAEQAIIMSEYRKRLEDKA